MTDATIASIDRDWRFEERDMWLKGTRRIPIKALETVIASVKIPGDLCVGDESLLLDTYRRFREAERPFARGADIKKKHDRGNSPWYGPQGHFLMKTRSFLEDELSEKLDTGAKVLGHIYLGTVSFFAGGALTAAAFGTTMGMATLGGILVGGAIHYGAARGIRATRNILRDGGKETRRKLTELAVDERYAKTRELASEYYAARERFLDVADRVDLEGVEYLARTYQSIGIDSFREMELFLIQLRNTIADIQSMRDVKFDLDDRESHPVYDIDAEIELTHTPVLLMNPEAA